MSAWAQLVNDGAFEGKEELFSEAMLEIKEETRRRVILQITRAVEQKRIDENAESSDDAAYNEAIGDALEAIRGCQ